MSEIITDNNTLPEKDAALSFQDRVRAELMKTGLRPRAAAGAAIAGILTGAGQFTEPGRSMSPLRLDFAAASGASLQDGPSFPVRTKLFTLLEKAYNITVVCESADSDEETAVFPAQTARLICDRCGIEEDPGGFCFPGKELRRLLRENDAAYRSFLGHVFLCCGSMGEPARQYRWEISCKSVQAAGFIRESLAARNVSVRTDPRRSDRVVVSRDAQAICAILNLMNVPAMQLEFENERIVRQMRASVNRQVNVETSNIRKAVRAAGRQIEDIELVRGSAGWQELPDSLKEIAMIRLQYPEASLSELGALMNPPVGKSGVNHRLRRLSDIAGEIRRKSS